MTTAQESTNGHRDFPPPCDDATSIVIPSEHRERGISQPVNNYLHPEPIPALQSQISDLPSPDAPSAFAASAYHVPPKLYTPKADSFHDTIPDGLSTMKLPDRCQFMFSDGRQCKMTRSDIHPSLCPYHSEREEQLFGAPHTQGSVRGPSFDLPELFSASRDLTTAAGVNRALGQVFRLLAQRRISRQEAATFAKLAHLLLQSIRAATAEYATGLVDSPAQDEDSGVILSESALADERRISPEPPPERDISSPPSPRSQPLSSSKNGPEPAPVGFVMKSSPEPAASSIFRRPATPVLTEDRFVLSGCARSQGFTARDQDSSQLPQDQHLRDTTPQPEQNEHLQNVRS